jgi:charged multivesicular body protein 4A/B
MTLENEIYNIEAANINKETLDAMTTAKTALKGIHAGLTVDKVDNVMYVGHGCPVHTTVPLYCSVR